MAIDDIISGGGSRNRRDGGSRKSASKAIIFWSLAVMTGAASAVMLKWYLDRRPGAGPALSAIAVAAMDLPLGTTLKAEHVRMTPWPREGRPIGAFTSVKDVEGRVLMSRVVKSEPIIAARLAAKEAGAGLAALIPANMRAAAVRVDDVVGVAGFLHPEDRVDVIVTIRAKGEEEIESKVILQNVKVLAVGKQLETDDKARTKAVPVTVATLLVTPEQSEKLALAASQGKLLLTLRSSSDGEEVATEGVNPTELLEDGRPTKAAPVVEAKKAETRPSQRSRRTEKVAHVAPASSQKEVVEILRGDRFEERKFEGKEKP